MRSPCVSFLTQTPGYARYELIAEAAHCARSTVAEALKALENAGVLSWVHLSNGCARRVLTYWATMGGAGEC